ncbi:MAG: hypothetical protein GYB31_04020 [Bacteroidetes bacterium]|nr:hypothetical protein [Bacteroidota bacterium]
MPKHPDRTFVHEKHIEKGIEKYGGKIDQRLADLLARSEWSCTPYRFNDRRILLVYNDGLFGVLYKDDAALNRHLEEGA